MIRRAPCQRQNGPCRVFMRLGHEWCSIRYKHVPCIVGLTPCIERGLCRIVSHAHRAHFMDDLPRSQNAVALFFRRHGCQHFTPHRFHKAAARLLGMFNLEILFVTPVHMETKHGMPYLSTTSGSISQ